MYHTRVVEMCTVNNLTLIVNAIAPILRDHMFRANAPSAEGAGNTPAPVLGATGGAPELDGSSGAYKYVHTRRGRGAPQ